MKQKIWEWLRAYIIDRLLGGNKAKAEAKVRRAEDKAKATKKKAEIAVKNEKKAFEDLDKSIEEIQGEDEY